MLEALVFAAILLVMLAVAIPFDAQIERDLEPFERKLSHRPPRFDPTEQTWPSHDAPTQPAAPLPSECQTVSRKRARGYREAA